MKMDVKNGLSCGGAIINDKTITINKVEFGSKACTCAYHFAYKLFIFRLYKGRANKMFFGDDQEMNRRLRRDIVEGKDVIVFIEFIRRDLTSNNLTEKAVFIHDFSLIYIQLMLIKVSIC